MMFWITVTVWRISFESYGNTYQTDHVLLSILSTWILAAVLVARGYQRRGTSINMVPSRVAQLASA